jgi:hypothetical protein
MDFLIPLTLPILKNEKLMIVLQNQDFGFLKSMIKK